MPVDQAEIVAFVDALEGVDTLVTPGAHYFYYDPRRDIPHDKRLPFATLIRSDEYDHASDLEKRGAYRVNLGVERESYHALFGPEPAWGKDWGIVATGHDFTAKDVLLPHPIYAPLAWICVVDPSEATWARVRPLVVEAHALARARLEKRRAA